MYLFTYSIYYLNNSVVGTKYYLIFILVLALMRAGDLISKSTITIVFLHYSSELPTRSEDTNDSQNAGRDIQRDRQTGSGSRKKEEGKRQKEEGEIELQFSTFMRYHLTLSLPPSTHLTTICPSHHLLTWSATHLTPVLLSFDLGLNPI